MNINNVADVIVDYTINFLNRLDLLMLTKVDKRFNKYKANPKIKHIVFSLNNWYIKNKICTNAAYDGYLEILKWARENNCNWNSNVCICAAWNGHLNIIKWAKNNGCDWNSDTCINAAKMGHLEVLKWAQKNGYTWDKTNCIKYAKYYNHKEIIEWINNN